jgi:hypothetical protein
MANDTLRLRLRKIEEAMPPIAPKFEQPAPYVVCQLGESPQQALRRIYGRRWQDMVQRYSKDADFARPFGLIVRFIEPERRS